MTTACEIGPGTIRLLYPGSGCAPADSARVVLAAGSDPMTLLGDEPVATADLWVSVFEPLLAGRTDVLLVHPSWWASDRVDMVVRAAGTVARAVTAIGRGELLHPGAVFVEIGPEFVAFGDGRVIAGAETRCTRNSVLVERIVERLPGGRVHIDAPTGVAGADALGALLARRLRTAGRPVRRLTDRHLMGALESRRADSAPARRHCGRRCRSVSGIAAVVVVLAVVTGSVIHHGAPTPAETGRSTQDLVEGRVTVRAPGGWAVRRVTDGPGSRRIEVVSPADAGAVLHITQSPVEDGDLAATAAALRAALAGQPVGVFVDFRAEDRRAGRPAVTYRELRSGREIDWTVVLSGRVRIAIGCQNATTACDEAIASAREIGSAEGEPEPGADRPNR